MAYGACDTTLVYVFIWALIYFMTGENEDEKLNEVMYEAWRFNRDCKLLRDGLQGLSWDGKCSVVVIILVYLYALMFTFCIPFIVNDHVVCFFLLQVGLSLIKWIA